MQTLHFGDITIDALSDGYLDLTIEGFSPDPPAETWKRYPESVVGDKLRCALTTYLIRTGGRTVLVDTGLG
ncbi:MAG TPA: MBL fold metallo-hydrolase, partial [Dehalococcoidia bacterium]